MRLKIGLNMKAKEGTGKMIERMGFEKNKQFAKKYGNIPETLEIGGKVCRFRSQGEKRLARYLQLLKVGGYIKEWAFEQTTFTFQDGLRYLVDFDVLNNDGSFEYYEFKGMVKQSDIVKLSMLFDKRPEVKLTMVFESRQQAAKLARRKVARHIAAIKIQSRTRPELKDFKKGA